MASKMKKTRAAWFSSEILASYFLSTLAFGVPCLSAAPNTAPEQAKMADSFVDSIGVNTHFGFGRSNYAWGTNYSTIILPIFKSSGIRHIRDVAYSSNSWQTKIQQHLISDMLTYNGTRIGFDLVANTPPCAGRYLNSMANPPSFVSAWITAVNIDSFEGLNEFNGSRANCSGNQWSKLESQFQTDWYTAAKAAFPTVPVIGPSLFVHSSIQIAADAASIGNLTAYMDFANQHSYPGGRRPSFYINSIYTNTTSMNGMKTCIATESGYHNDTLNPQSDKDQFGVTQISSGKYYSRLFFEYFNYGCLRTYAYELLDDTAVTKTTPPKGDAMGTSQANYGLWDKNGAAKPSGTVVSNEIALLSDPGEPFTPGMLNYTLTNAPGELHHTLLQKRNGTFYLILWQEVDSFDVDAYTDVTVPEEATNVQFADTKFQVNLYKPLASKSAFSSNSNVSSIDVSVRDEALILEIIPHIP
jgi:hypothetical protein